MLDIESGGMCEGGGDGEMGEEDRGGEGQGDFGGGGKGGGGVGGRGGSEISSGFRRTTLLKFPIFLARFFL